MTKMKPLAFQAIEAAKEQFSNIVKNNHSGLDAEMELQYVQFIVESFGESIYEQMDANSVYWAILNQAEIGLSVEEGLRHATYVFRHDYESNYYVLEFMPTYHGLIHLAFESGEMLQVTADQVFAGDTFRYNGSRQIPEHHSNGNFADGDVLCSYAIAETKSGLVYCETLTKEELMEIEFNASIQFSSNTNVWNTAFVGQMRKKSAIRRLLRLLFNQLGFENPEYRQRLKTLMSVEDNMYANVKSSIGHEIERAKRDKALNGQSASEALPLAIKTQPAVNPEKTKKPYVVVATGKSAADLIGKSDDDKPELAFTPVNQSTDADLEVTSRGFMDGW